MKIFLNSLLVIFSVFLSSGTQSTFKVKNELNIDRTDEVIILKRDFIEQKIPFQEGYLPEFLNKNQVLPCQFDDLNGDGKWDEVALLINISAFEETSVTIKSVQIKELPIYKKRTNLRLGIKQKDGSFKEVEEYQALPCDKGFEIIAQAESVSWENDKIAFRDYFDCRNVKDLFGKLKPDLIIDKIQTPEMPDYHTLADWGMDILHCGNSLGAGGIALLRNDSLFRLGSTDVYEYKKIVEGPVRSVFELHYSGWHVENDLMEAIERITIYPGKYWFESDITIKGIKTNDQVVTGIVTTKLTNVPFEMNAANYKCIGTFDKQSLNNDELGMAILVPLNEAGKIGRTSDIDFFKLGYKTVVEKSFSNIISDTYYIGQRCWENQPAKHYFSAVWGLEDNRWREVKNFQKYLNNEATKLSAPLKVY